jgi:cephalosporin-C deacetylase-like acetyl esterase
MSDSPTAPEPAYTPDDLNRFVDLLGATLVPGTADVLYAAVSHDGTRAAFLQAVRGIRQLCVQPLADGDATVLTRFGRGTGPVGPQWSPDGQAIAVDACDAPPRDMSSPYRVTQPVWRADGIGLVDDARTDIFIVPPFAVRPLTFTSADHAQVEGWYLEPRTGRRPHPTVLSSHGGPFAAHGAVFSVDDLLLTAAGYGVAHVNYRGSSGYGDDFAPMLVEDLNRSAPADLLHGVQAAVDQGLADTSRISVFGLSFGGHLTSWLLTHSDRFRAGIAECLHCDWAGMLGSDIPEVVATWMGSHPGHGAQSMTSYARMSPSAYAAACSAPLLIIAHEADLRCPPVQGDLLYNELQLAGKNTEMLRLPGVAHVPYGASLRTRIARAQALLEWIDRYAR